MTTNHLNQHNYAINVVVDDIGWMTDEEKNNVTDLIGVGVAHFTPDIHQLHLYWPLSADTLGDAIDQARATLRSAIEAIGVTCPHARMIQIAEIG